MLAILREDDTVVVARFFRLGRNRDHLIFLVNDFAKRKVHFKALDVGIDTTTPAGKLILSIFASLAEFDSETILEKQEQVNYWQKPRENILADLLVSTNKILKK
jgi:DNA invertase Pin-like site-specific DNA recombinase